MERQRREGQVKRNGRLLVAEVRGPRLLFRP